jgi:hypothetical protein
MLTGGKIWDILHGMRGGETRPDLTSTIFEVTHELAVVRERLLAHPLAPKVLKAFELNLLLDDSFPIRLAERLTIKEMAGSAVDATQDEVSHVMRQWRILAGCVKPLETLTVPEEVLKEKDFDEILTVELRYDKNVSPQAKTIAELLADATKLYEAVCIASGFEDYPPLLVSYIDSGSSIRFDLKGLGSPIKQIKLFFIDVWNLIRHRKADDFHRKGKAIIEGLEILERIDTSHRKAAIASEDANRLRLQINRAMLGLFEAGVLTREVPDFEVVPNRELMQGMQQRLLPPATADAEGSKSTTAKKGGTAKRKTRTRNKSRKNAATHVNPSDESE